MNASPKSVLFLVDRWVPGGVKKHILELAGQLVGSGVTCAIAAWKPSNVEAPEGYEFVDLPLLEENSSKSLLGLYRSSRLLRNFLIEKEIEILHAHSRYVTLLAFLASLRLPVKIIYTVHNIFSDMRYLPFYPKYVICLNEAGKVDFLKNWFLRSNQVISVIPNGIDSVPEPGNSHSTAPYGTFAFVGRLEKWKGADQILYATSLLGDVAIRILLAGSGPEEKKLFALAERLGISSKVDFLGHLDDPGPIYEESIALIVPSLEMEGFGYVVLEAFAHGRPVIASDLDIFNDTVVDGKTGLRFQVGNQQSLAEAMLQAMNDRESLSSMGSNGYRLLLERFTLKKMADSTLDVYRNLLSDHKEQSA
ncbi:MAG: glycosyltransferase family 4 protein [Xanthomonadales bacterium]|nr:glycosyltransferase family 4 protein [Xanthomonadales bacterium]